MKLIAVALVAVAGLIGASAARADDVSAVQLRTIARQALRDPAALARLELVDRVDGQRVDLARVLQHASATERAARLRLLAQPHAQGAGASDPRRDARSLLAASRFHEQELPQPLHGPLSWIGRRVHWVARPYDWLASRTGFGDSGLVTILSGLVALVACGIALMTATRRAAAEEHVFPSIDGVDPAATPSELERMAGERERVGDYEGAVRLRFRAGLLSLDRVRAIRYRSSLTSAELARQLRSDDFDTVARDFDEIVYGRRPAVEDDAIAARAGWKRLLARASRGRAS